MTPSIANLLTRVRRSPRHNYAYSILTYLSPSLSSVRRYRTRCSYFALFFVIASFHSPWTKITIVQSIVLSYRCYTQVVTSRYRCQRQSGSIHRICHDSLHYGVRFSLCVSLSRSLFCRSDISGQLTSQSSTIRLFARME